MSKSKAILALLFLLGGAAAFILGRREIAGDANDPALQATRELGAIQMAIERYRIDTGIYPTASEGLTALLRRPYTLTTRAWHGPYIDAAKVRGLKDPWGRSYGYKLLDTGRGTAYSLGADGAAGGEAAERDLFGAQIPGYGPSPKSARP